MIIENIQKAIDEKLGIEIVYTKFDGTQSNRTLSEITYSEEYGSTHIQAFCHTRQEYRTFKISRIESIHFIEKKSLSDDNVISNEPYKFNPPKENF